MEFLIYTMLLILLQTTEVLDTVKEEYGLLAYIIGMLVVAIIIFLLNENRGLTKYIRERENYRRKREEEEIRALMDLTTIISSVANDIKSQPKLIRDEFNDLRRDINNLEMRVNERITLLNNKN